MKKRTKGFTLIELLVVIAIIAILAAILFPVFLKVQEKGRQTKCMSNMRQLSSAMVRYLDDYNGTFPIPCDGGCSWNILTWRQRLLPYTKSKGILDCPALTLVQSGWMTANPPLSKFCHYGIGVGLTHVSTGRAGFFGPPVAYGVFSFTWMSKLQEPSKTIEIMENKDGDWSGEPTSTTSYWASGANDPGTFYPYHMKTSGNVTDLSGGGNFVFCDGHVKFMTSAASEANRFYLWVGDKVWWSQH